MNNPKTEEIVEALRCRTHGDACTEECVCYSNKDFDCVSNFTALTAAADRLDALEAEVSRLKEKQRWIPVTERLPETGITVLTLDKRGHMRDRALHTFRGGQRLFRPDGLAPGYDILYWMPLPELPKEAQNDPDKAL